MRPSRSTLMALVSAALLTACGGSSAGPTSETSDAPEVAVEISKFAFDPETIEITPGTSIVWTNRDDILHTVTSGRPQEQGVPGVTANKDAKPDGTFDEELDGSGATARVTLDTPGRYTYFCAIHPGMVAGIRVTG